MIKLKYSRLSIAMIVVGLILINICFLVPVPNIWWIYISVGVGAAICLAAFLIKLFVIRCPSCGFRGIMPQVSSKRVADCIRCGEPVQFGK